MVREAGLACNLSLHFDDCESIEKKNIQCQPALYCGYYTSGYPQCFLRKMSVSKKMSNVSVKKNVSGRHLESSYHQHQLIPSVSTGSTTTTGTSRALSFKCFSSCIPYTKCIENFIYRVVPCSNDQVVCFIKDSLVEHNHCCVPQ